MEWKEIKDFSNYEASDCGDIRKKDGTILKQSVKPNGYLKVKVYKDNKPYTRCVHRLVANAFLGVSDLEVNHIDGNKRNNNISNLEYLSRSANIKHAYDMGLIPKHMPNPIRKKVYCVTLDKTYESVAQASEILNIDKKSIRLICNHKRKSAKGLVFEWAN